ncbi:MAG: DUF4390 domain-containing protein [Nitrospirota bacterium]
MSPATAPRIENTRGRRGSATAVGPRRTDVVRWLAIALVFLAISPSAHGADESIDQLSVKQQDGRIYVSAVLNPGLSSHLDDDLRQGLAKDLYYYLVLKQRQRVWFDEEIAAVTVKYSIKYDLLKREYVVTSRLPSGVTQTIVPDFKSARDLVSRVNHVPVADVHHLKRGKKYLVSVKAEMKAPQLPLYLDYFLFFIPFLEIDTEWRDSATFRAPDGP